MSNINVEMKATADYAIKSAKEKFRQELDFSEQSLGKLENLLAQAHQSLSGRIKDEKTNNAISRTANIWGGYLGELMRYKWGGTWILKGSERLIAIKGFEFSPIGFVSQKITNHPEYSVRKFLAEVDRKISLAQVEQPQPQKTPEFTNQTKGPVSANKQQNSVTIDKKLIFAIAGIGGVLLVVIMYIVGFIILNSSGVSAEFKSNLNTFLVKAEKLNILTEQGVSNTDFRDQLAEVKSAYFMLNNTWPSSLSAEKGSFDQAIKGWELTLQVWDYGLGEGTPKYYPYLPENSTILRECSDYTNSNPDYYSMFLTVKDWTGTLMGTASQHFEQGRTSIESKLK